LELSNKTDLALKALACLNSQGGTSGSEMAKTIGTTSNYLPQVLKPLVIEGWICSTPGRGGGYRLCADLEQVSILDVIEAMEGETNQSQCVLRGAPCPAPEPCALHDSWVRARGALLEELGSTSVATTFDPAPRKGE
jgi:Rrf2 family protein